MLWLLAAAVLADSKVDSKKRKREEKKSIPHKKSKVDSLAALEARLAEQVADLARTHTELEVPRPSAAPSHV